MLTKPNVTGLPEIIWCQVFKYFQIDTFLAVQRVCKKFKEHTDNYADIYERECLNTYTSNLRLFDSNTLYLYPTGFS